LLYRGPVVGQDLGIYRGVAKPYRGTLYKADHWLNSFGPFPTYSLGLSTPGLITGVDNRDNRGKGRSRLKKFQKNLVKGQIGTKDLGMV